VTVRLRAHHLLCMLTYVGKGYSEAFVANYDAVVARLNKGEDIVLVAGPDDICAPLLSGRECHCHRPSVARRDGQAAHAISSLLARDVGPGMTLVLDDSVLAKMRAAFRLGGTRAACEACEWATLCTAVADADFGGSRLAWTEPG
jgi:uncharacterized protein